MKMRESYSRLADLVKSPTLVRELSWVEKFWSSSKKDEDDLDGCESTLPIIAIGTTSTRY